VRRLPVSVVVEGSRITLEHDIEQMELAVLDPAEAIELAQQLLTAALKVDPSTVLNNMTSMLTAMIRP
jgi:hypothetical protein